MRSRFLKGTVAALAIVALAGLSPVAATAATFNYSQSGGFFFDGTHTNTLPNPTQGNGTTGGLELSGPVSDPLGPPGGSAPANTYRDIGWGCNASHTNCAAAGTNVVSIANNPFDGANAAARSALRIDTVKGALDPILPVPAPLPAIWVGPLTGKAAPFAPAPTSGQITSDGNWNFLSHLFHDNSPIAADSINLVDAIIRTNLRISTIPQHDELNSDVTISFEETLNTAPCANPVGPDCADRFTFTVNTFGATIITEADGDKYLLEFDLFTNDPNIVIIGNTVWTGEGDINDLWVIMRLTQIVPVPGSLLLLGAGLLGTTVAGVARRRLIGRK